VAAVHGELHRLYFVMESVSGLWSRVKAFAAEPATCERVTIQRDARVEQAPIVRGSEDMNAAPIRAGALLTLGVVLSAGCNLFDCGTQARFLDARANLSDVPPDTTGLTGSAFVGFLQFRGNDNQQSLTWFIRGAVDTATVIAVHIHRGSAGETGPILFTFTNGYSGPEDVITQSGPQLWTGAVDLGELFDLIHRGEAYVDVHATTRPDGALRGQLYVDQERDWQDACT
jgi:hypothetical protein